MTKKKLNEVLTIKIDKIVELKRDKVVLDNRILSLIHRADKAYSVNDELKYKISQSDEEIECYRDLFTNSESDFQDLRVKYFQLKKTVIKEFQRNQRLKSENDCLSYNLNRALHDKVRVEKENRKQRMKIRDLMILKKGFIKYIKGLRSRYMGLGIIGEDPIRPHVHYQDEREDS